KMLRHKVCKTCGYLDGKEIINKADEIA
ncbi:MAG: 50S ribosomal protein L32, partial [Clostridiales bacterium]|nr:50S ribosomal protein L32 [Clostridiales bacterium]